MRKQKNDVDLNRLHSNFSFLAGVFRAITVAMFSLGGNVDHLRRVMREPALADDIARLLVPEDVVLPENHYRVYCNYDPLPSYRPLNGIIFDWANSLFNGEYVWQSHHFSSKIDQRPGYRVFLVKEFDVGTGSEDAIAWADANGYRPPTLSEGIDFSAANPELQRQFWLIILGSSAMRGGHRYVPVLRGDSGERYLDYGWFGRAWAAGRRFLFVRK